MKQTITLKTTGEGNYIVVGKMPLSAKKWAEQLQMLVTSDRFISLETCGRIYVMEVKPLEMLETIELPEAQSEIKPEPKIDEKKLATDLEKLGFKKMSGNTGEKPKRTSRPRKTDQYGKSSTRDGRTLYEWLKIQDYVIYELFVDTFSGRPAVEKSITLKDVIKLLESVGEQKAARKANLAITQLVRKDKKILIKNEETDINGQPILTYNLSLERGANYARGVYATVKAEEYRLVNGQRKLQLIEKGE